MGTLRERLLRHHNHPAKLVVDVIAVVATAVLLWQQHLYRAAAVGLLFPALASACVMWLADCETLRELRFGPFEARKTTWLMVAIRMAGVLVFWGGAWYRSALICAVGVIVIASTWVRRVALPAGGARPGGAS